MAGLRKVFRNGVEVSFKVFEESVINAQYVSVTDDGFTRNEVVIPIRIIVSELEQEDLAKLSFADEIQPTDLQCLVPGVDLNITPDTKDEIVTVSDYYGNFLNDRYSIVGFTTDPMKALYTIVLRNA